VEKLTLLVPRNILLEVALSAATMSPGCDADGKGKLRCAASIARCSRHPSRSCRSSYLYPCKVNSHPELYNVITATARGRTPA